MKDKENAERKNEIEKYMLRIENTVKKKKKTKIRGLSPQSDHIDRATAPHFGEVSASFCG
jgi:uncharacterized lipoprotein YddW (UPF0748 family)